MNNQDPMNSFYSEEQPKTDMLSHFLFSKKLDDENDRDNSLDFPFSNKKPKKRNLPNDDNSLLNLDDDKKVEFFDDEDDD